MVLILKMKYVLSFLFLFQTLSSLCQTDSFETITRFLKKEGKWVPTLQTNYDWGEHHVTKTAFHFLHDDWSAWTKQEILLFPELDSIKRIYFEWSNDTWKVKEEKMQPYFFKQALPSDFINYQPLKHFMRSVNRAKKEGKRIDGMEKFRSCGHERREFFHFYYDSQQRLRTIQSHLTLVDIEYGDEEAILEQTESSYRIYPNPVDNWLYIEGLDSVLSVQIIHANGQVLLQKETAGWKELKLDVSFLETGGYLLVFRTKEGQITKRLLKI